MTELKIEHVLLFVIVAFVMYHFMGRCRCGNGFCVSGADEPLLHSLHRLAPWIPCPFDACYADNTVGK